MYARKRAAHEQRADGLDALRSEKNTQMGRASVPSSCAGTARSRRSGLTRSVQHHDWIRRPREAGPDHGEAARGTPGGRQESRHVDGSTCGVFDRSGEEEHEQGLAIRRRRRCGRASVRQWKVCSWSSVRGTLRVGPSRSCPLGLEVYICAPIRSSEGHHRTLLDCTDPTYIVLAAQSSWPSLPGRSGSFPTAKGGSLTH